MNNLHRELAPVSDAAWASIEEEARRTFEQHVAARRVVDLTGPEGQGLAGVGTGHLSEIEAPADAADSPADAGTGDGSLGIGSLKRSDS